VEQAELRCFEALCGEVSDYITHLTQLIHAAGIIRELNCPEHQRRDDHMYICSTNRNDSKVP
jgi:hypothetical protein